MTVLPPRQPTDVWVRTATSIIRSGLIRGDDISPDEAATWLTDLEDVTIRALHALDDIEAVIVTATAGPSAERPEASTSEPAKSH